MEPTAHVAPPGRLRHRSGVGRAVRRKWERLRAGLARGGAEYLLTSTLSYLPSSLVAYEHHVLMACDRGAVCRRRPSPASTRVASEADAGLLAGLGNLTPETVERRLGRGDVCVVAFEQGRPVASAWAATGTRHLVGLGRVFDVPPTAFYVYDLFTEPDMRQHGLATAVYQALFAHFADEGRTTAYAAVEVLNESSLRAHESWGFVSVGRSRKLLLPGLRTVFCPSWPVRGHALQLAARWRRSPYRPA